MEPTCFKERVKWHLLARMMPLVENNYNFCELGRAAPARATSTRKSARTASWCRAGRPRWPTCSTTWRAQGGLVGLWDVVAFDEVAGINFKDHDGVQIMKDYMASGSFSRGP
jgi:ATP-dependent Lon protease